MALVRPKFRYCKFRSTWRLPSGQLFDITIMACSRRRWVRSAEFDKADWIPRFYGPLVIAHSVLAG
jgi:hypothetical protein